MLAGLPVRPTFEKYGGDAYFDENWAPVMIIDDGLSEAGSKDGEAVMVNWPATVRVSGALGTPTRYGVHLQTANLFVTALREQMSAEHPIRRFLTPFTYQSISVNDNAKFNLTAPKSMGPRCFAFTDKGVSLAFAAAPYLLKTGETEGRRGPRRRAPGHGGPVLRPHRTRHARRLPAPRAARHQRASVAPMAMAVAGPWQGVAGPGQQDEDFWLANFGDGFM
eukprot:Skav201756  [mRNA]  locus=scaffold1973:227076:231264:- [translate_table: standard]